MRQNQKLRVIDPGTRVSEITEHRTTIRDHTHINVAYFHAFLRIFPGHGLHFPASRGIQDLFSACFHNKILYQNVFITFLAHK